MRTINFTRQTKRDLKQTLFPFEGYNIDYDNHIECKDKTMKSLKNVAIQMSKSAGRVSFRSHLNIRESQSIESHDPQRALFAKREYVNGGKKQITLSTMQNYMPRDDKMYDQTDLRYNINLENTRMERQSQIDKKNEERMTRMRVHTQKNQRKTYKQLTASLNSSMDQFNVVKIPIKI